MVFLKKAGKYFRFIMIDQIERSEWSANWPGVQGAAIDPQAGSRGRAPGGGPGGKAPGSSRILAILTPQERPFHAVKINWMATIYSKLLKKKKKFFDRGAVPP